MHHSVLPAASPTYLRRCMVLALAVVLVFGLSACSGDDTNAAGGAGGSGGATGGAGATGGTGAVGGDAGGASTGGSGGTGGQVAQVTSTTIGPAGGTAISADGAFEVSIPPGALDADTDITIETIAPADVPAGVIGNAYELGPDGLVLPQHAARLTATVTPADLGGEPPQSTRVAMEGAGGWYPILGAPPLSDPFKVSGFTTHFSRYAAVDFNPEKYCVNQAVGSDPDPCACDMNAVQFCAAQLGISVWTCGWTYAVYPVGGFMEEKLYDALDCYEGQTGYENVYETGGGTQCERNCCRSAEAPLYRAPHGAYECINRQGDSVAEACLANCAAQGNDKTQCELAGVPVCASCGDGLLHEDEQCEPSVQTFTTCNDIGLSGGPLGCLSNCTFDSSQCCVPLQKDACPGLTAGGDCGSFDDGCGGYLNCGCGVGLMCESNLCVPDPCYQVDCSGFPVPTDYCLDADTVVFHAGPFCSDGDCVAAQGMHNCPDDPDFHTYCTPGGLCVEP